MMIKTRGLDELIKIEKKIVVLIMMLLFIFALGTVTFVVLEHQSLGEAIYSTVASAIGHGFIFQSRLTMFITFIIMIVEWLFLWTLFDIAVEFISEGKVREIVGGMKMKKRIDTLKNHCVLCGFGRVGSEIARNVHACKKDLVVVEKDAHAARSALSKGYMVVEGDVLNEETLRAAGVDKAKVLITAMGSDADNVFVTLTAKEINPRIKVVARAEREESVRKLKQAGATEVVMPEVLGGKAMAEAVTKS